MPNVREFAMLSASAAGRLRRYYYRNTYVDAVMSGLMGGGGKADTQLLQLMARVRGWIVEPPETLPFLEAMWRITDTGREARQRYLSQPKGKRKK